jgi:hypothetical protein
MSLYFMVRKHFPPVVTIVIWVYMIAFVETIDYGVAFTPFRIYYCGDNITYEPSGTVLHFLVFPPFSFFFLYFYDKWRLRGLRLVLYMLIWSGFAIGLEWIFVINGVFTYTGWKLPYSFPVYIVSDLMLIKLYQVIKKNFHDPLPQGP